MSKRDAIILNILIVAVLLIAPSFFVTRNILKDADLKAVEAKELATNLKAAEARASEIPTLQTQLENELANLEGSVPNTANLNKSYDIQNLFASMAAQNGLALTGFTTSDPQIISGTAPTAPPVGGETEQAGQAEGKGETTTGGTPAAASFNAFSASRQDVTLTVSGLSPNILKLIDSINSFSEYAKVTSVNIPNLSSPEAISAQLSVVIFSLNNGG